LEAGGGPKRRPDLEGVSVYDSGSRFSRGWKGFASLVSVMAGLAAVVGLVVTLLSSTSSADAAQVSDVQIGPSMLAEDAAHEFPVAPDRCAPGSADNAAGTPRAQLVSVDYTPVQGGGSQAPPDVGEPQLPVPTTEQPPSSEPPTDTGPGDGTGEPTTPTETDTTPTETTPTQTETTPQQTLGPPPEDGALARIGPPAVPPGDPVPPEVPAQLVAGDPNLDAAQQQLVLAKTRTVHLKPVGLKLQVVVDFDGKENDCVGVNWTLFHARTGRALSHPWQRDRSAGHFTVQDPKARAGLEFFVALPRRTGSYRIKVMVVDGSGRELDVDQSGVFH
jgi:hypothetical protein